MRASGCVVPELQADTLTFSKDMCAHMWALKERKGHPTLSQDLGGGIDEPL